MWPSASFSICWYNRLDILRVEVTAGGPRKTSIVKYYDLKLPWAPGIRTCRPSVRHIIFAYDTALHTILLKDSMCFFATNTNCPPQTTRECTQCRCVSPDDLVDARLHADLYACDCSRSESDSRGLTIFHFAKVMLLARRSARFSLAVSHLDQSDQASHNARRRKCV